MGNQAKKQPEDSADQQHDQQNQGQSTQPLKPQLQLISTAAGATTNETDSSLEHQIQPPAPLLFRGIAYFLDIVMISIIATLYSYGWILAYQGLESSAGFIPLVERTAADIELLKHINRFIIYSAYMFISYWLAGGQTLGKKLTNLRVVSIHNSTGQPVPAELSAWQACLRTLGLHINNLLLGAGFLLAIFRKDRRALHDLIAKTRVVHDFS